MQGSGQYLEYSNQTGAASIEQDVLERGQLENYQKATLNLLEDINQEKTRLEETQRALINILEDFDAENTKVARANRLLQMKSEELNRANEALAMARDTLEIRVQQRTAELQLRTLELEASNRELESFSYSVSHDLRAPLRVLDGFSLALLEDYGDRLDETAKEYLLYIRSASQRMSQLIDEIRNLSRIVRTELRLELLSLSDLAREVAGELSQLQPDRKVDLQIAPYLTAWGDRTLLRLVFENLLGNAYKFTRHQADARIEFGMNEVAGKATYYVRDNGTGFETADDHDSFNPYQILHRPDAHSGADIGLATVQRIINRLGGRVWAEGSREPGAMFCFTLREKEEV